MTQVVYYTSPLGRNPIDEFLNSLLPSQQAKILRILTQIKEYGLPSVIPHIRKLSGTHLWEIRILGKDNLRVLYASFQKDSVVILHGFIKKKQKTPERDLNIALNRFRDWMSRTVA